MHAALITGQGQVELREFPDPTPTPTGVVVDVTYCGICGTDIHAFQSGKPYNPAVCGHEWTGTVSAIGADVKRIDEGDRVVVAVPPACGSCTPCRSGQSDRCMVSFLAALGRDPGAPEHGGFAPQIGVDQDRVVRADTSLSDEQLAQVEPATVAFHAVRRSGIRLGDTVVVQGAGPIGLLTLQCAAAAGAGTVIVIEPNEERRSLAECLGATITTSPADADAVTKEHTRGLGADIVYECVGRPETVQTAVDLARRGGTMSLIGLADSEASINPNVWLVKEISISSSLAYLHEEFEMCMGLMADGRLKVDPMHTSTTSLDGFSQALADLGSGQSTQTKVLVKPTW